MAPLDGAVQSGETANDSELLAALAGTRAARDGAVANRTRRVVLGSLGLMKEQKAGRKRTRSMALVGLLLAGLGMGPFVWRVVDDLIGGEHLCDLTTQLSLLICVFCPALVAAVLMAGWLRRSPGARNRG
jgi:hypothetical protein